MSLSMADLNPNPPQGPSSWTRCGAAKSRNGCARCKGQRLKCDEGKPACGRCVRVGVQCPGYVQPLRWSTKHQVSQEQRQDHSSGRSSMNNTTKRARTGQNVDAVSSSPTQISSIQMLTDPRLEESSGNQIMFSLGNFEDYWDIEINDPFTDKFPEFSSDTLGQGGFPHVAPSPSQELQPSLLNEMILWDQPPIPRLPLQVNSDFADPKIGESSGDSTEESSRTDTSRLPLSLFTKCREAVTPLRRGLNDSTSVLVEYYFKDVAGLISCYDSQMNPFRSTVSRLWTSSRIMSCTLQSIAAACLVDEFPHVAIIGKRMRREALALIEMEEVLDEKSLLALLMLGETGGWHEPNDLGLPYFNRLKKTLERMSEQGSQNDKNVLFFREALVYWEMLLSFVADDSLMAASPSQEYLNDQIQVEGNEIMSQKRPHPWTGICRETQRALYEVGRLVRKGRRRVRVTSQADIEEAQAAISKALQLEATLLDQIYPSEYDVISPGDSETPVSHLLIIADVYRFTGLIQLYRVFPDLLGQHCGTDQRSLGQNANHTLYINGKNLFEDLRAGSDKEISQDCKNEWLTNLAVMTLGLLQSLPIGSRTRSLTPFFLVALSSELGLPLEISSKADIASQSLSRRVCDMRQFVVDRLTFFLRVLAPKPIYVCLDLVREIWRRMDAGENNVYWMDVMIENGWETTMG